MVMIWNIKQNFKETGKDTEKHNIKNVSIIGTISVVLKKLITYQEQLEHFMKKINL